jgi:hypothetical protein
MMDFVLAVHNALLPFRGPGEGHLPDFMCAQLLDPCVFAAQLRGRPPRMCVRVVVLVAAMHARNKGITQFHP